MESFQQQMDELRHSIKTVEAQRTVLGEAVANLALAGLRQQLARLEQQAAAEAAPAEERRLVTILFMDMVGSTSRAEKLDPEEWQRLVERFHAALGHAVTSHSGTIAQYLGDGLLAFFGARQLSESDPENAIRAALSAQGAVADLLSSEKVQVRAGIHTGLVVVGELGEAAHGEFTASGDAVNLAARLQSAAPPGGVLISHDTYRYVRGVFDFTPRPPLAVKGKSDLLQTYLVRQAKPRAFRTVARGVAGVEVRTIGRDEEFRALQSAYLRAYEDHGVVWAQLVGQPGIGKSRLVADLNDWTDLREETFRLLRARGFPDDANQPFTLIRRMWFDRFQIAQDAPRQQAEAKWVERFQELAGPGDWEEASHALGLLVGLPFRDSPHIRAMRDDPAQVKGRAFVVSRALIQAVRQQMPIVVLLEDLQWADAASRDYLVEVFLDQENAVQPNGLFILGAARPEWHPPRALTGLFSASLPSERGCPAWGLELSLPPLDDSAVRDLAQELLQRADNVPNQMIDLLVERSEGVPYYAEEMVNWFIDNGILETRTEPWHFLPERLKGQPLPATLQHLLLTRLSNLSPAERAALQRGAIFGRRFWTGGVEALGLPGGEETLGRVQQRGFVEVQPESAFEGDTEWSFQQSLLRDVTYESVLKRERAALHRVAAEWLERQANSAGRLDEFAGLLGDHRERAGELSAAADWYLLAGRRAAAQGAPREARAFYTQALNLLPPVERERRWQALLGREEALRILSEIEPWKADVFTLIELAPSFDDDNYVAEAYLRQSTYFYAIGDQAGNEAAVQAALMAARRGGNQSLEAKALSILAALRLDSGDKVAGLECAEQALLLARRLGDECVLGFVLTQLAYSYMIAGDVARSYALQLEQVELDHRLGDRAREALGLGNIGDIHREMGRYKQARTILEQARAINAALGARRQLSYQLMNLGEVYLGIGDLRTARQWVEQALQELAGSADARATAYALIDLGLVLMAMDDGPAAARRFSEAHELAADHGLPTQACEAAVCLASSAIMQGQLDDACKYVHDAWDYLAEHGQGGMPYAGRLYRTCAEIFDALGDSEKARQAAAAGYRALMQVADSINIPEWRQSYLQNVPDNRALLEMWERLCK